MQQPEDQKANSGTRANAPRLERLPAVQARTGLSRTTIWRRSGRDFPSPVRLGNASIAWVSTEVDDWIAGRITARRGGEVQP